MLTRLGLTDYLRSPEDEEDADGPDETYREAVVCDTVDAYY